MSEVHRREFLTGANAHSTDTAPLMHRKLSDLDLRVETPSCRPPDEAKMRIDS